MPEHWPAMRPARTRADESPARRRSAMRMRQLNGVSERATKATWLTSKDRGDGGERGIETPHDSAEPDLQHLLYGRGRTRLDVWRTPSTMFRKSRSSTRPKTA